MKYNILKRAGSLALCLCLLAGAALTVGASGYDAKTARAASLPVKQEPKTGVTVYSNDKASIDASNLAEGYVMVTYTGGKNTRIKVLISKTGSTVDYYQYTLNNTGAAETFPLTEGDGAYTIRVMENTTGTKYAQAHTATVNLTLRNDYLPYLYPNQFVNYTSTSQTVTQGAAIVTNAGATTDLAKVGAVFDWVVDNFTYDYDLAATVQSGYLPDVDQVLAAKKGICFDYAAVMSAMLRSQNIPCKLVVGYAGTVYHAWINVYIEGAGWVDKVIYFDGVKWTLMDPTFTSSGKRSDAIMKYVTTESNYVQKFAY